MKKKVFLILLTLLLAFGSVAFSEAAEAAGAPSTAFDWTDIFIALIGLAATAISSLSAYAWKRYIHPWLTEKSLIEAADIVVNAVEALLGRHCGEDKWKLALEKMQEKGWDIESDAVIDALKAAWKKLDLSQLAAGEKTSVDLLSEATVN